MKEGVAQEHIGEFENRVRRILTEHNITGDELENMVNMIMYEALLYSCHYHHVNENVVMNMSWEYFNRAKKEILGKVP